MSDHLHSSATVLIVDDDEDILFMVNLKLKKEGYKTLQSHNGSDYREIIAHSRPDLILLDIQMDGISGLDICHDIKGDPNTAQIPILMFSANENIKTIVDECGADGYITKPFSVGKFRNIIDQHLPHS